MIKSIASFLNKVFVNGKCFTNVQTIRSSHNRIYIDDLDVTPKDVINVEIRVEGNINHIDITSGKVTCKDVKSSMNLTSGKVEVSGNVHGDVKLTSGSLAVNGSVSGSVKSTSGKIIINNK